MSEESDEADACRMVTDVAINAAIERCGSDEAVQMQLMDLFGFADDEPMPDVESVLRDGLPEDQAANPRKQREYALCRSWEMIQSDEDISLRSAMNRAWMEVREAEGDI